MKGPAGTGWQPSDFVAAGLLVVLCLALPLLAIGSIDRQPTPGPTVTVEASAPTRVVPGPVTTVTATATATATVTARPEPASRSLPRQPQGWAAGAWDRFPAWVEQAARCIAAHESAEAGLWLAENPYSTASGFAQWVDGTWAVMAARAGVSGYGHASQAPPAVQALVFAMWLQETGDLSPWAGTGCS